MKNKEIESGLPAGKWESLFRKAGVEKERLEAARSEKSRTTILGNFLAQNVGREVPVEINGRSGKAILRMVVGRANRKQYFFEISWDEPDDQKPDNPKVPGLNTPSGPHPSKTRSPKCGKREAKTTSTPSQQAGTNVTVGNSECWS